MGRMRLFTLLLVLPLFVHSQSYTTKSTAPKKLQKLFEKARYFNQIRDLPAAERELLAIIDIDPAG